MRRIVLLLAVAGLSAPGCAWVALDDAGEDVQVLNADEVNDCDRVGNTHTRVLRKVWFVPRRQVAVDRELENLARNEGAKLGGNTVTPMGGEEGERDFAVYVCGD